MTRHEEHLLHNSILTDFYNCYKMVKFSNSPQKHFHLGKQIDCVQRSKPPNNFQPQKVCWDTLRLQLLNASLKSPFKGKKLVHVIIHANKFFTYYLTRQNHLLIIK